VNAFYGIVLREFQRLLRQRARVLSGLARPLLWLFIVGSAFGSVAEGGDPASYRRFMLPGVMGMVILFSSMFGALSTAHDKEFGVIRLMLIAPIRRVTVILAKITSSALVAVAQSAVLLLLLPVLGLALEPQRLSLLLLGMILTAFALSALAMLLVSRIDSLENFSGVINFVVFPMFFLSGALYPLEPLPRALRTLAAFNPLTYGVDLMKWALLGPASGVRMGAELRIPADVGALLLTFAVALGLTTVFFDREARLTRRAAAGGAAS
jgi:ABC-2 type transport system permease protein